MKSAVDWEIRNVRPDDLEGLIELERVLIHARDGMVKRASELVDPATLSKRINSTLESGNELYLVAVRNARIEGECTLGRFPFQALHHVGRLALGIHPEAQGAGLGRAMMNAALAWARAYEGPSGERLLRLELFCRADNHRARNLYTSLGFELEGIRRQFMRLEDGRFVDDCVMSMLLS